jgi:hypothetical protein
MPELLASLLIIALAIAGLALGLLCGRRPVQGSCGGLNNIPGISSDCGNACRKGKPCPRRQRDGNQQSSHP